MSEITGEPLKCPRCGGTDFEQIDCGPDSYEDDISYTSQKCSKCRLWFDGWSDKWLVGVEVWQDAEGAQEFKKA